jgi:V/A-type H+-transporting ATPase subunit I
MAVAQMAKVIIVSHRSQASELLEALQREGICHILNADEAMLSRDFPELGASVERPKNIEGLLNQLEKNLTFLKNYAEARKGLAGVLSPRTVVDEQSYDKVVSDREIPKIIEKSQQLETSIEKTISEIENLHGIEEMLSPWSSLETPVEEIGQLRQTTCWAGLIPVTQFEQVEEKLSETGAAIQQIGATTNKRACLIVAMKENADEVQKLLRSAEFEPVSFEPMTGTVAELITEYGKKLDQAQNQLQSYKDDAAALSVNLLKLEILYDHHQNLLNREQAKDTAPATEHTVLLEGWVKKKDYSHLEKIVSGFEASSLTKIEPAEDEDIPVEIENKGAIKPFEVITRLYGMPQHFEVDPTVFLAPFFALFFALCLTDAGYGLVIIAAMVFFIKKMQGDKKLMWMLGICAAATVIAGALTGGWFGDSIQKFIPGMEKKELALWFDPFKNPMMFFGLSLALGYFQILAGLAIAFVHNLKRKNYVAAVCDQLTWLVMLNSIVLFFFGLADVLSPAIGKFFGMLALIPAGMILLFSERQGGWGGRIGMGAYNLFSTIFYVGDVLSYLRLMALGMVTAGIAMAVNVIAKICLDIPYGIGVIAMILILVGGHGFNLAMSGLGAFVHTLRLQYVEFYPKFFVGGGRQFVPLNKKYKHIYIKKQER